MPTVSAALVVQPGAASFLATKSGARSKPKTVSATNSGSVSIQLTATRTTGDFQVSSNTCGIALAAHKNCAYKLVFAPTAKGHRAGSFTVMNNGSSGPRSVSLSGTGK
jgi:hypothetical protein